VPLTAFQLKFLKWTQRRLSVAQLRLLGSLNITYLQKCLDAVVQRHEPLRTRIVQSDGVPCQHVDPTGECHLNVTDLSMISSAEIEREAKRLAEEFFMKENDVSAGPLFDAIVLRLADFDHVLLVAVDHIVSDGISCAILMREIQALYNQISQRLPFSLPKLNVQFADYAVWQQQTYNDWLEKHEAYWRERLARAPQIRLQRDDVVVNTHRAAATLHFPFGKVMTNTLRDLAKRERTLLPLVFLTAYVATMARWCNQHDLVLKFISHGRHSGPEFGGMVGLLATVLHLRTEISKGDCFLDLLKRVTLEFFSANQHRDFDRVSTLIPECTTDLYFNWVTANRERSSVRKDQEVLHGLRVLQFTTEGTWIPEFFTPIFSDTAAGVCLSVRYPTHLYAKSTIERFGRHLRLFATEFAQRPSTSVESVILPK